MGCTRSSVCLSAVDKLGKSMVKANVSQNGQIVKFSNKVILALLCSTKWGRRGLLWYCCRRRRDSLRMANKHKLVQVCEKGHITARSVRVQDRKAVGHAFIIIPLLLYNVARCFFTTCLGLLLRCGVGCFLSVTLSAPGFSAQIPRECAAVVMIFLQGCRRRRRLLARTTATTAKASPNRHSANPKRADHLPLLVWWTVRSGTLAKRISTLHRPRSFGPTLRNLPINDLCRGFGVVWPSITNQQKSVCPTSLRSCPLSSQPLEPLN